MEKENPQVVKILRGQYAGMKGWISRGPNKDTPLYQIVVPGKRYPASMTDSMFEATGEEWEQVFCVPLFLTPQECAIVAKALRAYLGDEEPVTSYQKAVSRIADHVDTAGQGTQKELEKR